MEGSSQVLIFFVNGKKITETKPDPEMSLLRYLRERLNLSGTKLGCAEGGCGACTVMISRFDRDAKVVRHFSANACLMPVCAVHGLAVTTVEGIGSTRSRLHPVQERIAKAHGSQCGFCTPGIVMSMYALLRSSAKPSMKQLELAMQGNLCRCTGYRPILEGYRTFTHEYEACAMGDKCCKLNGGAKEVDEKLFEASEFAPLDPSQEPIFPPELKLTNRYDAEALNFVNDRGVTWFRPVDMSQLLQFKKTHGVAAKIVVGNSEVGVEVKFKHFDYKFFAHPSQIRELSELSVVEGGVKIGAAVTLTELKDFLQKQIDEKPEESRVYHALVEMLHWFAGTQVRNVASIGGNIVTSSPISDLNPILLAAGAELELASADEGRRIVKMDKNFFTGYRKNAISESEVLVSVTIPKSDKNQHFVAYKQAKRREDDITIVTAAFSVSFDDDSHIVRDAKLAFGGMAAMTILAPKTAASMVGRAWDRELVETVNQSLVDEISLEPDAPGGVVLYRHSLTLSLFFKAFLTISDELEKTLGLRLLSERDRSGKSGFHTLTPKSSQLFEKVSSNQPSTDPVHRPKIHSSALKQATGEAIYCDDIPRHENELYLALVLSTRAHAKILSVDASEALSQPGVHAFFSAKDVNQTAYINGVGGRDEELFISETVTSEGQILGAIAADDQLIARRAARLVQVKYEELTPVIITLEDAIKHDSFFPGYPLTFSNGDIEKVIAQADHVVEGETRIGGQEHFYLETHSIFAIPKDCDEIEIFAATQQPAEIQRHVANFLEIPQHRVVCRAKRIGGGFGGKETRGTLPALPVALAAYRLKRPVRMALDRDEDMMITGGRNPMLFKYKIACTKEGKVLGLDVKAYLNAGYSIDYSNYVIESAYIHITNSYRFNVVHYEANVMKTNTRSNTAFRGFGAPQAMLAAETMIRDVARATGKNYIDVMKLNLCETGDVMHNNQLLENCNVKRCFEEVQANTNLQARQERVEKFNSENRWKKRGISVVNNLFAVGFPPKFMNQGGALVHVYLDGSVLLSHGGVEMGQGLHTKMIQVASRVLQLPMEKIHVQETATDKVPNAISTAASVSSDLYGGAVMDACQIIFDRLALYREKMPDAGWNAWVSAAYFDRVSLSATGFFATPDIGPEINRPKNYFTHGSAVSEVEVDCLTGDHQVIRTDIVMDVGSSLNPAIDIGQIEGAFMQGYGLFMLEELIYSPTGTLYSRGPGMYKIPSFGDIPAEFNVSLLTGAPNPRAVYSSRAVGEPPLFLASSVFFAIKEAIGAARREEGLEPHFYLQAPATSARIRMACQDEFTQKFKEPEEGTFTPWNVAL